MIAVGLRILREEGVTHGRSGGSSMSCRDLNSEHQFQKQNTWGKKDEYILMGQEKVACGCQECCIRDKNFEHIFQKYKIKQKGERMATSEFRILRNHFKGRARNNTGWYMDAIRAAEI